MPSARFAQRQKPNFGLEMAAPLPYNSFQEEIPVTFNSTFNVVKLDHAPRAQWKRFIMLCRYSAEHAEMGGTEKVA
jgi:hypothetical protein